MSAHEQFAEDLALYSLGELEGEDRAKLEAHLGGCSSCRADLEQLRGDGALLALSAMGPRPPQRARQRLLDAVAKEAAGQRAQQARNEATRVRRSWWGVLGWAAAAAVVVFTVSLWKENGALRQTVASMRDQNAQSARELADLRQMAAPLLEPEAQVVTVAAPKERPQPGGKVFYLRRRGSLVFLATNMPVLPANKAFELWLIPTQGSPIPAGVFKADAQGRASVINPPLPANTEAKAFAITVENEAGATTPTMPIVMMGAGE